MSKTFYVELTDEQLNDLALSYKGADPISDEKSFMLSLALEELKRNRQEKKDGLVVELPCSTGDMVYFISTYKGEICKAIVQNIHQNWVTNNKAKWVFTLTAIKENDYTNDRERLITSNLEYEKNWWKSEHEAKQAAKEAVAEV